MLWKLTNYVNYENSNPKPQIANLMAREKGGTIKHLNPPTIQSNPFLNKNTQRPVTVAVSVTSSTPG
jgi:hypothetical protein